MSDAAAKTNQPTSDPARPDKRPGRVSVLVLWVVILIIAGTAFAGAVVYSGGIQGSLDVLSAINLNDVMSKLSSSSGPSVQATATAVAATSTASTNTSESAVGLPQDAQEKMFVEQINSQPSISALATGKIDAFDLGVPTVSTSTASVPVSVSYGSAGSKLAGTIRLRKYGDLWYFDGLTDTSTTDDEGAGQVSFDSSVVKVLTDQQATPENQKMLVEGILGGGFKQASVARVTRGAGTATVEMMLSGGTWTAGYGRFVLISKTEGSRTYWFIARLDEK